MIYDIKNPSDPYTIESEDFMVAAIAVALLGNGAYAIDGTPILWGWDDWFEKKGINLPEYLISNEQKIADALDSVLIGTVIQRFELQEATAAMCADTRARFYAKRHESRRTSMNDIGARAKTLATSLRAAGREGA